MPTSRLKYVLCFLAANPDLISGTWVGVFQYLLNVTLSLALGSELVYQSSPQLPGWKMFLHTDLYVSNYIMQRP